MGKHNAFWWIMPAVCFAAGIAALVLLHYTIALPWSIAQKEGLVFGVLLFTGTLPLYLLIRAYPTRVGLSMYAFTASLVFSIALARMHGVLGRLFNGADADAYRAWLHQTIACRAILYPALLLLFGLLVTMRRRVQELESRYALQQDAAALLREAELFKLRQQLQPHFLYNSLNAISSLIITAPDKAGEMTIRLSDFLRASVRQGRTDLVPLDEELDYLRNYLWIEAARFGERLQVSWHGLDAAAGGHLPPFLLQPLLENAIKFGVYGTVGDVVISVSIARPDGLLQIMVSNPFDAAARPPGGTGFGLEGIRRRLYLMYARQDLLRTHTADGLFIATLLIPQPPA